MTLSSRKELNKLIIFPLVVLLLSLLLLLKFQSVSCSSSSCRIDQRREGAAVGSLLQGRRLLVGCHGHGEAIAKGLMEPVVAKKKEGGEALGQEDKREVITGPNPLHNRR
ncbi:unnamed protein product [Urochloa humidicola]